MKWREMIAIAAEALLLMLVVFIMLAVLGIYTTAEPGEPAPSEVAQVEQIPRDYRRVIVAVYYMPGKDPHTIWRGIFGRKRNHKSSCPGCVIMQADEPRLMEARPDVFWGLSGDGMTPRSIVSFNGDERSYKQSKMTGVDRWPMVVIYSGTPGSWGEERYRMTGYTAQDFDRLIQMIDWAAEY